MRAALLVLVVACSSPQRPKPVRYAGVDATIARGDLPKTTSVVVMRAGAIEYETYFGDATADTLHDTRSASKSLTALAVGIAIDKGLLPGVTAPAFAYLDDLAPVDPSKAGITIEDLLTMSSALDCDDNLESSPGNEENMYPKDKWAAWAASIGTSASYTREPNGRGPWHYCTGGTMLLGHIVERAAKQPVDVFMAEQLFAPLGITKWELTRSPTKEPMMGGGLRLRSRDLATLAWLVRNGGTHAGKQIVSAAFVKAATTAHRTTPYMDQDYGYLYWHRMYKTPCGTASGWSMGGNGGNSIVVFAELDAVVVVTRTAYNTKGMHQATAALIEDAILPELACKK